MKIGVLAYHSACNFGANLQILSTIGYLRRKGHEPVVINYEADDFVAFYKRITSMDVYSAYAAFRQTVMPLTEHCSTAEAIAHTIEHEGIEAIIIGSDAVAQHHTLMERIVFPTRRILSVNQMTADRLFPNPFWGTFADYLTRPVPMALLSASNQDSEFRYFLSTTKRQMQQRLQQFCYISARDVWTQKMYQSLLKGEKIVEVTPDPVFAFNQNCADLIPDKAMILAKYKLPERYILLSFFNNRTVSQEWLYEFERLATAQGIACVALPFPQGVKFTNRLKYTIPSPLLPLDWYALIKYSQGYVGGNMHPIVVSLHNAVPFFSFDNWGRTRLNGLYANDKSSKVLHILSQAGLAEQRVSSLKRNFVAPTPDFVLNSLLNFDKERARNFAERYAAKYEKMMSKIINSFV